MGDTHVVDLAEALSILGGSADPQLFNSTITLFAAGDAGLDGARRLLDAAGERATDEELAPAVLAAADVRLLAPVPRPPRLRDYLTNDGHAAGAGIAFPPAFHQMPVCYKGNHLSVIGPDAEIVWPEYTDQLDFELEPAFVVGVGGRNISAADAYRHIAGVTLFNDISARDIQFPEMSMMIGPSKSKDFCNVIGPCVATLDEIDEFEMELEARVNGEVWSRGTTAEREYSFGQVLAWASYCETVHPGEVLAIGTMPGCCGLELDRWIQPGDVLELEMTGVGVLRNRVGQKERAPSGSGLTTFTGAPRSSPAGVAEAFGEERSLSRDN
jgi:2-keto-4-pentenoate hydratase/2-oxohepta-3-ene-1,7-dioic acid hydratase in catechol pathway